MISDIGKVNHWENIGSFVDALEALVASLAKITSIAGIFKLYIFFKILICDTQDVFLNIIREFHQNNIGFI